MVKSAYKKYMKNNVKKKNYSLIQLFIISFFGMLLVFTFLIKLFSPSVDLSIGGDKQEIEADSSINVDGRLSAIQNEDRGQDFTDLMKSAEDIQQETEIVKTRENSEFTENKAQVSEAVSLKTEELVYKVYVGTYTSIEQAKVAKDIIQETGLGLNPIVKCLGSNDYTLQVGIFKNKAGAESLLSTIQKNHLPGRIVEEN
mgnify:CR=1 FL=1